MPHKPWSFTNYWHTIAWYESDILFCVELVEENYSLSEPPKKKSDRGETICLVLILNQNIHSTGNIFLLDFGLCVLQVLVDINKKVVHVAAISKKRR